MNAELVLVKVVFQLALKNTTGKRVPGLAIIIWKNLLDILTVNAQERVIGNAVAVEVNHRAIVLVICLNVNPKRGNSALFHTTQTSQKLFDFTKVKAKNFTAFLLKVKLTYSVSSNSTLPHHLQKTPLLQRGFL